ncbi:MAG: diacylglycerol kinase family protein [Oscillospiraceae bacterium]|nr:diacylglycerol kinase family protein [Oscillospiraceae bacterium]
MTYHVLYNPRAGSGNGEAEARNLDDLLKKDTLIYHDITAMGSYADFFGKLDPAQSVILAGGDGTINRFLNATQDLEIPNDILYYAVGSGNDFLHDVGKERGAAPFSIKEYLKDLPTVTVKGKRYRFLNGIGYGIDGYCCEAGDRQREKSNKPVNYTAIAIKGLLFHYKPVNAEVTVDGKKYSFKKVWLAPTMNGRYYGGGMKVAPDQDRLNKEKTVSLSMYYGAGKLKALMVFPSIFKGEHIKHTEMTKVISGHEITVKFDKPTALQIDGETILAVTEYSVSAGVPARV